jgi:hypothetical protein
MARPRLVGFARTKSGRVSRSRETLEQRNLLVHDGYVVYFAKSSDRIKIGFSGSTKSRMPKLDWEKGDQVRVLAMAHLPTEALARKLEAKLHAMFAAQRLTGEWFNLTMSQILDTVSALKGAGIKVTGCEDASGDIKVLSGLAYAAEY